MYVLLKLITFPAFRPLTALPRSHKYEGWELKGGITTMNLEMKKLAVDDSEASVILHLILRMSGKTQDEVAKILHVTRQQVSA